eukprot:COSAG02_NODE_25595_length_654_cov_0.315315_1_plen_90_part_00
MEQVQHQYRQQPAAAQFQQHQFQQQQFPQQQQHGYQETRRRLGASAVEVLVPVQVQVAASATDLDRLGTTTDVTTMVVHQLTKTESTTC